MEKVETKPQYNTVYDWQPSKEKQTRIGARIDQRMEQFKMVGYYLTGWCNVRFVFLPIMQQM